MVAEYVKHLVLRGMGSELLDLGVEQVDAVLSKLPALEVLLMQRITLRPCPDDAILDGWASPKALQCLFLQGMLLYGCDYVSGCCFVQLANLFGRIGMLDFDEVVFAEKVRRNRDMRAVWHQAGQSQVPANRWAHP